MSQKKEIMIIEDTVFGSTYRDMLLNTDPQWNVTWISSIEQLKKISDFSNVQVFVFDQRLDNSELGSDAFKYVHSKNPLIQGVMLSGVALADDLEVLRREVAPSTVLFLGKKNIEKLPETVRNAFDGYYLNAKTFYKDLHEENVVISGKHWLPQITRRPQITLVRYYTVDENCVFDDTWVSKTKVRAGEERTDTVIAKTSFKGTIVSQTQYGGTANANVTNDDAQKAIELYFKKTLSNELSISNEYEHKTEFKQQLPQFSETQGEASPVALTYQENKVYKHLKVTISIKCFCCGDKTYSEYDVYIPKHKTKERLVFTRLNGSTEYISIVDDHANK